MSEGQSGQSGQIGQIGKILATGDLMTGEITRHTATEVTLSETDGRQLLSASNENSELKKKLKEFGFVEQEFPADGSFTFGGTLDGSNLVN